MSKRFLLTLVIIIIALGGIFWLTRNRAKAPGASSGNGKGQVSNHVEGQGKKGVTLIEYGDFQCPACGAYYPVVKQVQAKFSQDIYFQFRNFPLVQLHPNAFAGARAAEAASLQGKFWEMHDLLYERQQSWSTSSNVSQIFADYATELGLNLDKFKQDYASSSVNGTINADMAAGLALGANATPTFVLDGKRLDQNPQSEPAFEKLISDEIAKKNPTNPQPSNQ